VLPLDDTDRALQLLMSSFPELRIRTLTPWLVLVDAP
jgi:transmembrane sensor